MAPSATKVFTNGPEVITKDTQQWVGSELEKATI